MCNTSTALPAIRVDRAVTLPDNDQWQFRFEIRSETSDRIYVISQNKKGRYWGCSCPAWRTRRYCKHLAAVGLPSHQQPYEVNFIKQ